MPLSILADDELEGALLSKRHGRAGARCAKLDATSRDEGAEPQDLFVTPICNGPSSCRPRATLATSVLTNRRATFSA